MAHIRFAKAFRRHVECPEAEMGGATVGKALAAYFDRYPAVRSYVVDEHGALRMHINVFVDSTQITDPVTLGDAIAEGTQLDVFQALSGG